MPVRLLLICMLDNYSIYPVVHLALPPKGQSGRDRPTLNIKLRGNGMENSDHRQRTE